MDTRDLSNHQRAQLILTRLKTATKNFTPTASESIVAEYGRDPFLILISCILSLRTKDAVSLAASHRLFSQAKTPATVINLSQQTIEQAIYPVGFYKTKAKTILAICHMLLEQFHGTVPSDEASLLKLPGVGRKTMNLVQAEGFELPALCVDVHVHRISNRLGLVNTTTPEQTEQELKALLPSNEWREYNTLLVKWGQNVCVPVSPFCSQCVIAPLCPRNGVVSSR